jgi:catechol 2,3-dioxygenase-like lactoylglutathione lyase family enzyme
VIRELRIALTVDQFDQAVHFYRDVLGFELRQSWDDTDGRGVILELPRATLEILDRPQADAIDRIETGRVIPGNVRLAVQVNDLETATDALEQAGAMPMHASVQTPWGHHNQRVTTPDGRQMTLFQPEEVKS